MTTSIARLKTSQPEAAVSISQFKLLDHLREQLASKSCDPDHPGASELRDRIDQLRSEIAHSHFGLVSFVVGRFRRSRVERSEMLGEARLILAKAIDRFDWKRGFQFSTYYVRCAIRHLRHFVARQARIRGLPPSARSSRRPPRNRNRRSPIWCRSRSCIPVLSNWRRATGRCWNCDSASGRSSAPIHSKSSDDCTGIRGSGSVNA